MYVEGQEINTTPGIVTITAQEAAPATTSNGNSNGNKPGPKAFIGNGNGMNIFDSANVYGKTGKEIVKLQDSANAVIDQNIGRVEFAGQLKDYSFQMNGNQAYVFKGNTQIAVIGVKADATGTALAFADGATNLKITGLNQGALGGQQITNANTTAINPNALGNNFATNDKATVGTPFNNTGTDTNLTFLDSGRTMTLVDKTTVRGSTGKEIIKIGAKAEITADQNIGRVELNDNLSDCGFKIAGNQVSVFSAANPTVIIAIIGVQGDTDGTILAFKDGSTNLKLSGLNKAILGALGFDDKAPVIGTDPTKVGSFNTTDKSTIDLSGTNNTNTNTNTTQPTGDTVSVTTGNTAAVDASTKNVSFNFAQGNYTYNIDKFGAGDKLSFANNAALSILNTSGTDGVLDVTSALNNQLVTVHLTNVDAALDAKVFSLDSFNTTFGASSLVAGTPPAQLIGVETVVQVAEASFF